MLIKVMQLRDDACSFEVMGMIDPAMYCFFQTKEISVYLFTQWGSINDPISSLYFLLGRFLL